MKRLLLCAVIAALLGCATAPAVPLGNDTYLISQTSAGGIFRSMSSLKTEVIEHANAFAASQGKVAIPVSAKESPAYPGHMPSFDYEFRLVEKNDPQASGRVLLPRPDVVVDVHTTTTAASASNQSLTQRDSYTELLKLDDLLKRGIISESEFEAQKAKILSGN